MRYCDFCIISVLALPLLAASEHHGLVIFNRLPVPGATVTAIQDDKKVVAVTDPRGFYSFPDLNEGLWQLKVEMFGFASAQRDLPVVPNGVAATWELTLLPLDEIHAEIQRPPAAATRVPSPRNASPATVQAAEDDLSLRAADGFLINGSMNNGAASPFAQAAAFGNGRSGARGLYTGGIGMTFDSSALDARPFSLAGQDTPKASYGRITGVATLGGPLRIPRLLKNGPNFFAGYQWTRNNNATTESALVPDRAERDGILSTGAIPLDRISPQARALLAFYPLPNFAGSSRYNYQIPIVSPTHQDALQSRFNQSLTSRDQIFGGFAMQSTRTASSDLFGFLDTTDVLGINTTVNWAHRINPRWFLNLGYQFSRLSTRLSPYFQNRQNVSGQAGISGNNQDPGNWGPPALVFASGLAGLSDSQSSYDRNQTNAGSYSIQWNRGAHNISFGGDLRRRQFNYLSQQDPRGAFTFTGAAAGSAFADFLLGIPDAASVAFGNADKYFRESVYDAYVADDWRVGPALTLNAGVRWEYGAPITELYDRLVNLDTAPGFAAVTPLLASHPVGALTGQRFPGSLVRPDKHGFQPRVGIAWHPASASNLVVRAGYGVYYDSSVYQTIALQMSQQPPLSKALSVSNSAAHPLTLASGFDASQSSIHNTFAIDPNFRVGYAQNWQLSVQRNLPHSLQVTATYLGIQGTRGVQEFLPNTFPTGAASPCPGCPTGFAYLASNGNSTRHSAQIQLRRRLRNGLGAMLQYTFSKSIDDDAALGGQGASPGTPNAASFSGSAAPGGTSPAIPSIAQNWLDLRAERGLSTFDQRHLLTLQMQYTTGVGLTGGTLLSGWKGAWFKDWTFATQIAAGSGLPQTPVYLAPVQGTGVTGSIRPDYTGAPVYAASPGLFLNPAAFTAPSPGQWGNAGRDSITGPAQLTLNASLGRTLRLGDRLNLDLRLDSTNLLNHVTFTGWNTIVNSAQFGLPAAANAMRAVQTTLRLRF